MIQQICGQTMLQFTNIRFRFQIISRAQNRSVSLNKTCSLLTQFLSFILDLTEKYELHSMQLFPTPKNQIM